MVVQEWGSRSVIVGSKFLALLNHRNGNGFAHLESDSQNHFVRLVVISSWIWGGG